jgi:hypothetical protein
MATTRYIVDNLSGQTITEINSTTINTDTISATNYLNLPIPDSISSGPFAPGSAVVANDTDVDINFSDGVGTAWSFSSTGLTFPDDTIQTTAYTGGTIGTSGIDGTSGTSGKDGSIGSSGTSGINGSSGTSGINGSSGTSGISATTGSWTLSAGTNTVSFTVTAGQSYVMWVNGNIANGIVNWNATVTLSNTNVPAIGVQYGWWYDPSPSTTGTLVLTAIPNQIVGTAGGISTTSYLGSTSNVFTFDITNNSGSPQIVYYGYVKIS